MSYKRYIHKENKRIIVYLDKSRKEVNQINLQNIEEMQKMLEKAGFELELTGEQLTLRMDGNIAEQKSTRYAGRRKRIFMLNGKPARYSDIIYQMQTKTDTEIRKELGNIVPSTYYKHKKQLLESKYYQMLDKNKLLDEDYLCSIQDNMFF